MQTEPPELNPIGRKPHQLPLSGEGKSEHPSDLPDREVESSERRFNEGFGSVRRVEGFRRIRTETPPAPLVRGGQGFIPYDPRLVEKARENRKRPTEPERRMWNQILSNKRLAGYKFLRQKPLDRFIVDFYCQKLALVIEIDGDSHSEQKEYDRLRSARLAEFGIQVIRYTNREVMENIEGVFKDLMRRIEQLRTETPPAPLIRGGQDRFPLRSP